VTTADHAPAGVTKLPIQKQRPTVVLYTHSLIERSMTFIVSHGEALANYRAVYAGSHRVDGLALPSERMSVANNGGLGGAVSEYLFRRYGLAGRLARNLRIFQPTLVHAHFGQSGPAAIALADALEIPMIVTYHGQDATMTSEYARRSWRGREYLRGKEHVKQRASLILAVSDFIRARLIDQGFPADKVITHRNGIDVSAFQRSEGEREPVAVFVGRFVEKKGCEYLIRALGKLRDQGCDIRGILVGDGPLRPTLEQLAGQVGAKVEFTGFLALPEVRKWLGRACVAVVPSVTAADGNSEGLPTVILEAQAMGTPVVATRHAGNAEGLIEGKSALLVAERDVDGLAQALRFLWMNPAMVQSFGAAGRAFVESHFAIEAQVAGLERIYDRVRGVTCRA
jgi:glycosyltransferase involved in cell wall biosynthesis